MVLLIFNHEMKQWVICSVLVSVIFLLPSTICYETWIKIQLNPLFVVGFPARNVTLLCSYEKQNSSHEDNIRWTEGQNDNDPVVFEKSTSGKIHRGVGYETAHLGEGCSLIITNHTFRRDSVQTYTVKIVTLYTFKNNTASTNLIIRREAESEIKTATEKPSMPEQHHYLTWRDVSLVLFSSIGLLPLLLVVVWIVRRERKRRDLERIPTDETVVHNNNGVLMTDVQDTWTTPLQHDPGNSSSADVSQDGTSSMFQVN